MNIFGGFGGHIIIINITWFESVKVRSVKVQKFLNFKVAHIQGFGAS